MKTDECLLKYGGNTPMGTCIPVELYKISCDMRHQRDFTHSEFGRSTVWHQYSKECMDLTTRTHRLKHPKEEEDEEVVELEVTFTWSAEQEGEYQEVHKEVILLDLTDYMEEYLAYKSDPEAIPEMSDWIEGLCGYPGYDGDGDLEQTWVEK